MKTQKAIYVLLAALILLMALSLAGCDGDKAPSSSEALPETPEPTAKPTPEATPEPTPDPTPTPEPPAVTPPATTSNPASTSDIILNPVHPTTDSDIPEE